MVSRRQVLLVSCRLQIKDKMLDSQNASLADLKAEVARLKSAAREAEDEAGRTAAEWKERLRDEIEQVSRRDVMLTVRFQGGTVT